MKADRIHRDLFIISSVGAMTYLCSD